MAIVTIQTIKNWFKTGLKPTQAQFWAVFDSFRHKSDKVPFNDIDGLTDLFNEKADAEALNNHINSADAHADLLAGFLSDADLPSIPLSTFNDDIGAAYALQLSKESSIKLNHLTPYKSLIQSNPNGWDESLREVGNVIFEENRKIITYSGHSGVYSENNVYIGLAISTNGDEFVKGGINGDGKIIGRSLEDPYLIFFNNKYFLYAEDKEIVPFKNIRCYTSTDLVNWTDEGVILDVGLSGSFDSRDVSSPSIIVENGVVKLFYEGRSNGVNGNVGLATSNDGLNFSKHQLTPIFEIPNNHWASQLVPDDVIKLNSSYYLSFHGYNGDAFVGGVLFSNDLINWKDIKEGWFSIHGSIDNDLGDGLMFVNEADKLEFVTIDTLGGSTDIRQYISSEKGEKLPEKELVIGGRNYLPKFTTDWFLLSGDTPSVFNDYELTFAANTNPRIGLIIDVDKFNDYTITFKTDLSRFFIYKSNGGVRGDLITNSINGTTIVTFNTDDTDEIYIEFNTFSGNTGFDRYISYPKLEKGNTSTDWTPSPDDMLRVGEGNIKIVESGDYTTLMNDVTVVHKDLTESVNTITIPSASICNKRILSFVLWSKNKVLSEPYFTSLGISGTSISTDKITIQSDGVNWYQIK